MREWRHTRSSSSKRSTRRASRTTTRCVWGVPWFWHMLIARRSDPVGAPGRHCGRTGGALFRARVRGAAGRVPRLASEDGDPEGDQEEAAAYTATSVLDRQGRRQPSSRWLCQQALDLMRASMPCILGFFLLRLHRPHVIEGSTWVMDHHHRCKRPQTSYVHIEE